MNSSSPPLESDEPTGPLASPAATDPGVVEAGAADAAGAAGVPYHLAAWLLHEVDNQLALVRASVQLGLRRLTDADTATPLQRALETIDRLHRQMRAEMLVWLSPVRAPRVALRMDVLIQSILEGLRPRLELAGITLAHEGAEGTEGAGGVARQALVVGSPPLLRAALANLLHNAVDAMPAGGQLSVEVAEVLTPTGRQQVQVIIEDTGPGLPEADDLPLFREPVSTKPGTGRGIGLLMAHDIIARIHGGQLRLQRCGPQGGTRAVVALPAAPATPDDADPDIAKGA